MRKGWGENPEYDDDLRSDEEIEEEYYQSILDAEESLNNQSFKSSNNYEHRKGFFTKIAGVIQGRRQESISKLKRGIELNIVREYDNAFDVNAIAIFFEGNQLGYLPKKVASNIAPQIDAGQEFLVTVSEITGGGSYYYGVNVYVEFIEAEKKVDNLDSTINQLVLSCIGFLEDKFEDEFYFLIQEECQYDLEAAKSKYIEIMVLQYIDNVVDDKKIISCFENKFFNSTGEQLFVNGEDKRKECIIFLFNILRPTILEYDAEKGMKWFKEPFYLPFYLEMIDEYDRDIVEFIDTQFSDIEIVLDVISFEEQDLEVKRKRDLSGLKFSIKGYELKEFEKIFYRYYQLLLYRAIVVVFGRKMEKNIEVDIRFLSFQISRLINDFMISDSLFSNLIFMILSDGKETGKEILLCEQNINHHFDPLVFEFADRIASEIAPE